MPDEHPKCQYAMSYGDGENPDVKNECGKPATHYVPKYEYKPTDVHLCEAHADEASSTAKHPVHRPVRRWRPRPQEK